MLVPKKAGVRLVPTSPVCGVNGNPRPAALKLSEDFGHRAAGAASIHDFYSVDFNGNNLSISFENTHLFFAEKRCLGLSDR